jgi:3-methyladenine DNA glycosylase AlkD
MKCVGPSMCALPWTTSSSLKRLQMEDRDASSEFFNSVESGATAARQRAYETMREWLWRRACKEQLRNEKRDSVEETK